ncbi:MAG: hypothetical protein ACRD0P_19670 [Stackebrandtia sp.]
MPGDGPAQRPVPLKRQVAAAAGTGELLWNIRAAKESQSTHKLYIRGVTEENVLVHTAERGGDEAFEAKLLDIPTREVTWSHGGTSAVGMADDVVLLAKAPSSDTGDASFRAVALDMTNGKQLDILESDEVAPCVTDSDRIACGIVNQGLATISGSGKSPRFSKLPDTDGFETTAVASDWIYTTEPGEKKATCVAVDPAGNTMEAPGRLADINDELAVVQTDGSGVSNQILSVYTVNG